MPSTEGRICDQGCPKRTTLPTSAQGIYKALIDGATAGTALADRIEGQTTSFDAYAAEVQGRFESYRANRAYLYSLEQRWADAPFWKKRQAAMEPPESHSASLRLQNGRVL